MTTTKLNDYVMKSLKILKGKSESVNRRTNNTMVKRKGTKRQNTTQKTKDSPLKPRDETMCSRRVSSSC